MIKDIHIKKASKYFNIPEEKVTDKQRKIGKILNFGELYGFKGKITDLNTLREEQ